MNKKILAFLLALLLVVSTAVVGIVTVSANTYDATIKFGGKSYGANEGDTVTLTAHLQYSERISNVQGALSYDSAVLSVPDEDDLLDNPDVYFPVIEDDMIINPTYTGTEVTFDFNATKARGFNFKDGGDLLVFEMTVSAGETNLDFSITKAQWDPDTGTMADLIINNEVVDENCVYTVTLTGATEIVEQPPTEPEPTEPEPTEPEPTEPEPTEPEPTEPEPTEPEPTEPEPTEPEPTEPEPTEPEPTEPEPTEPEPTEPEPTEPEPTEPEPTEPEPTEEKKIYVTINGGDPIEMNDNGNGEYTADVTLNEGDVLEVFIFNEESGYELIGTANVDKENVGTGTLTYVPAASEDEDDVLIFDPVEQDPTQDPTQAPTVAPTEDKDEPTDAETTPEAETSADSETSDKNTDANYAGAIQTGSTATVMAFFVVLIMALGIVFFIRKKAMSK